MRAPEFWRTQSWVSTALLPVASIYDRLGRAGRAWTTTFRPSVPVICVGNLVAGGAGKTPIVLELAQRLKARGLAVHLLTRGYRGKLKGPIAVNPALHGFRDVGDEALLLARAAPTWVARDRALGAEMAAHAGADVVVMDDGLQNAGLVKDLALVAVDGGYGFGNGRVIPAGPLRERIPAGLRRAHAAILIGEDRAGTAAALGDSVPIARARLVPENDGADWAGRHVVAFAGIGRPQKFFDTLAGMGVELAASVAFADHHPYLEGELAMLLARARTERAVVVTTEKDWVRLPPEFQPQVEVLRVKLGWTGAVDEAVIDGLLDLLLAER